MVKDPQKNSTQQLSSSGFDSNSFSSPSYKQLDFLPVKTSEDFSRIICSEPSLGNPAGFCFNKLAVRLTHDL